MEKYGVNTHEGGEKNASEEENTCPICGKEITTEGGVRRCPVHGSAPFEAQDGTHPDVRSNRPK